jgi:TolB protein
MAHTNSNSDNLWSIPLSQRSSESTAAPKPLTRDTSYRKSWPIFSPDGKNIAFWVIRIGASRDLWMMDADGNNPVQLTTGQPSDVLGWLAHDQIAYLSKRGGTWKVWSTDIHSGREKPLFDAQQAPFIDTNRPFIATDVTRLSPDGRKIVFNSRSSGTVNVWTVPIEGGQPKQLTFDKELAGFACWSPDGKYLAFEVKRGDDTHIAIMPSNGGTTTQLTFDHGQSWPSSWSPDGDKIAFAGLRNGFWNIWWVSRSTKQQKQITKYSKLNAYVRYPAWSPLGNQIVYEQGETTGNIWTIDLK